MSKIESITATTVRIDGRVMDHSDVLRWAKSDAAWAMVAGEIAAEAKRQSKDSYDSYCRKSHVASNTVAGHGSISIGPDRDAQAQYQMLDEVVRRLSVARPFAGGGFNTIENSSAV